MCFQVGRHCTYSTRVTFLEIQNAVLVDRFSEAMRGACKDWINFRAGKLWSSEPWSFKTLTTTLTIPTTASSAVLSNSDIQRVLAVWDATTDSTNPIPLRAVRPEEFYDWATTTQGLPNDFTVYGGALHVDRVAPSDRILRIVGERDYSELTTDGQEPQFPEEFHYALVLAARAEGLRREQDPSWQADEAAFERSLQDLRSAYLTGVRGYASAMPAWP
jgi:hypothetical protein